MKRILSLIIAAVMVLSLFPAMVFTSSAEDAVDYQHVTVRTENITTYPQQMTAGAVLDVVGGTNPIDAGAANNVRPTDKGIGGSAHPSYNTEWNNGGAGSVAMRSANTWLYGYVIKVEGLDSAAQANVTAQGWGHNGSAGAGTTGGGWNMEYKNAKYNIPGDGVYAIFINGQVFGGSMNAGRVAVAYIQKMQLSLNKDATVTFLGEVEAATEDLTADSFANTLPINYMVNGTLETVEYPITEGLSKGQYVMTQDAVAIPVLDKKLDVTVTETTKSTHIGWATEESAEDANVEYAISEKGIPDALYPVYFTVPNVAAPTVQDGWFGTGDVVRIPNTDSETIPNTGVEIWNGDAQFAQSASAITFVIRATGVESPIEANKVNPYFINGNDESKNWSNATSGWSQWNNTWTVNATRMPIYEDGVYYLYLNRKVLANNDALAIKSVQSFNIFDTRGTVCGGARSNTNTNATLQVLAVVPNDLQPTVSFYDENGNLLGTKTHKYTNVGNNTAGDATTGDTDDNNLNARKAKQFYAALTPDEFFADIGAEAPTKASDENYTYKLVWVDENKQPVEAIYQSQNLYASFVPVDADNCSVRFNDVSGSLIAQNDFKKGVTFASIKEALGIANQTKDETDDETYTFKGWTVDSETIVADDDVINADSVVFSPVFVSDKKMKATLTGDLEIALNGSVTLGVKLNRADITTDVIGGVKAPVTSGTITISTSGLTNAEGETTFDITFDEVDENGVTNATFTLDAIPDCSVNYTVTLSGVAVTAAGIENSVHETSSKVSTAESWVGKFFNENSNRVNLEKDKIESTPIWNGSVDFGANYRGVTFVFKVSGIETPLDVTGFDFKYNGIAMHDSWFFQNEWLGRYSRQVQFDENGYYLVYYNDRMTNNSAYNFREISDVSFFVSNNKAPFGENSNENASVSLVGVVALDLQPIVTFHDATGKVYGESYQKKYTDIGNNQIYNDPDGKTKQVIKLAAIEEIIEESAVVAPAKAEDEENTYLFNKWVDADGNDISDAALYKSVDLYPTYTAVPKTVSYNVVFMNGEEQFGDTQEVFEYGKATAPETLPTKADDATGYFTFEGWSLDGETVIDVSAVEITSATTFYAVYSHTDVTFTVTYMNGEEVFYTETVIRSKDASYTGTPKRATDAYVEGEVGNYHVFDGWADENGDAVDLTNIQGNITVKAAFKDIPVEIWRTVTWHDDDGTVLATAKVADGDGVSAPANIKGSKDGTADEHNWYTFNGWDVSTAIVTGDIDAHPAYTETPVMTATNRNPAFATAGGAVGTPHVLYSGNFESTDPKDTITIMFKISGASDDNPVAIGGLHAEVNGCGGIGGNLGNQYTLNPVTKDGYYFVTLGRFMICWTRDTIQNIKMFRLDQLSSEPAYANKLSLDESGEASYEAYLIEGKFEPTVRYYDEEGNWLYTAKKPTYDVGPWSVVRSEAPTPASLYKGADLGDDFLCWVDAEGNEVAQIYDNMDVYAAYKCRHTYTATGAGTAVCAECGNVITNAPTVTAGDKEIKALKSGETFTLPVVITNNPGVVGVTLSVETSANVSLTGASVEGTLYEGAYMTYVKDIVLNRGENISGNITEDGTVVYLTLTAQTALNEGDEVSVKVSVTDTADTDLNAPVLYSDYTKVYSVTASDPKITFDTLSFTVGNTMSFNVNVKFTPNSAYYDTNESALTVEMLNENGEYEVLGERTLTAEKDESGTYDLKFSIDGIPMAYLANSLRVHFTTVGADCDLVADEDQMMNSEGENVSISFVNYSEYLKSVGGNDKLTKLLDTMLNYTAAIQLYKGYKADDLANKNVANKEIKSISDYTPEDWSAYSAMTRKVTSSADATVRFTGSKLLMTSDKTGFRFVFAVDEGLDISKLTLRVKCGDNIVKDIPGGEFVAKDGKYYADFDGYAPNEFDTQINVIIVNENGDRISNMAYDSIPGVAKTIAADSRYESMRPILSGMLAYSNAVKDYITSK